MKQPPAVRPIHASSFIPDHSVDVAAGLIFREGKLLIAQRPLTGHLPGVWEFPGGKRHSGESFEECLRRELREELGVEVEVGERLLSLDHDYPERRVHLEFFCCRLASDHSKPEAIGCPALAWVKADELESYAFPAADARLLERLKKDLALWR